MKLIKKDTLTASAALVAGGVGAGFVYNKAASFVQDPKLRAGVPVLLGIVLMGQKSKMIQNVGAGMVTVGGQKLVGSFVPGLAGMDADEVIEGLYDGVDISGSVINGTDDVINGHYNEYAEDF